MSGLPTGTVTFLFTDIEGSTKLAREHPETWESVRERHHAILQSAMDAHNGFVFQIIGDAFCVAFHTAKDGLNAAVDSQRNLQSENWNDTPVKVRMGIHTGEAQLQAKGDYHGYIAMSRVQRLMSAGHGGQVLISTASQELIRDDLPKGISLRDLGEKRLKDLIRPEHLYQLVIPDLTADFPPLKTLEAYRHNLPSQITSFIGRENEIAEVKNHASSHRLVTLTGSGGTGKTRLSLQVAVDLLDSFPDGVWFVELAPLSDPNLIPSTILSALGISEQSDKPALDVLQEYLQPRKLLLVLDNCEHLIANSATVANAILSAAPDMKILASSREALGVKGELSWHVPSLSLPDPKKLPELEALTQYESVRLFIDRAILVNSHFTVTKDNAPAIAQICYRLDGIPLALELAAARVKMLSVDQISSRLDDRFRLLTGGARTALPRQQTLRSMIDWSYDLLSEQEKTLFRRLAVFVGGWTLEAAEAVCGEEGIGSEQILDLLSQLVNKSLVNVENIRNESRYHRLETIRQYAREKLFESGEGEQIRDQHLKAFVKLAEQAESEIRGHNQLLWLHRLDDELENLRAALEWSQERDNGSFLRLASALWRFWDVRGYIEDFKWLPKALASTERLQTVIHARALARAGYIALNHPDPKEAEKWSREAVSLSRELGDNPSLAMALFVQGTLELNHYNSQAGAALLEQALTLSRGIKDHWLSGILLMNLGFEAWIRNDLASARSLVEKGLEEARLSGDKRHSAYGLQGLSLIALAQGDLQKAEQSAQEASEYAQELGDKANTIGSYWAFTNVAMVLEDFPRAEETALEAYMLAQAMGEKSQISYSLVSLGFIDWAQGNLSRLAEKMEEALGFARQTSNPLLLAEVLQFADVSSLFKGDFSLARTRVTEALAIYQEENYKPGYCFCLERFGMLAIDQGRAEQGARLLGAREKLRLSVWANDFYPFMVRERNRYIAKAREQLGEETFNKAWAEGTAMSTEVAVRYALEESSK